jgi:hypothetical protein
LLLRLLKAVQDKGTFEPNPAQVLQIPVVVRLPAPRRDCLARVLHVLDVGDDDLLAEQPERLSRISSERGSSPSQKRFAASMTTFRREDRISSSNRRPFSVESATSFSSGSNASVTPSS